MKFKLSVFALLLGLLVFGWLVDAQFSVPEKINIAFPPSPEVISAYQNLQSLAQVTKTPLDEFEETYSKKLQYRSLNCLINMSVSRLDSIRKIKKLPINAFCLSAMDNELRQFLEMQQVAIRILQPPLIPQIQLGQKREVIQPAGWISANAIFSSNSSVAVFSSESGYTVGKSMLISYDIKGQHTIANLSPVLGANLSKASLSPNGRVLALPDSGNVLTFLDTETGAILWRIVDATGVSAWLPDISAAILKDYRNSTILMADFSIGKVSPYIINSEIERWAINISGKPSKILVGGDSGFYVVENSRKKTSIESIVLKEFNPKFQQYSHFDAPLLMESGNTAVFARRGILVLLDLDSDKEVRIDTTLILNDELQKLDELRLLARVKSNSALKAFNIKDQTLSSIIDIQEQAGSVSAVIGRNGLMQKDGEQVWVSDNFTFAAPVKLQALLAELQAQLVIEEIEQEAKHQREIEVFGMPTYAEPPEPKPRMPGELVGDLPKTMPSGTPLVKSNFPGINLMPRNARIEFIAVNESANQSTHEILLKVNKTERPIVLILSSCNTVDWKVSKDSGSRLLGVLQQIRYVSSRPSFVTLDNREYSTSSMARLGNTCIFKRDSPEYKNLEKEVYAWTGKFIEKFQSADKGVSFSVGN